MHPLLARRASLHAQLSGLALELDSIRDARATATADDEHDPEGSTLSADWSRTEGLRADALAQLAELELASERLAAGTYGVCLRCGGEIPAARLAVRPAAGYCVGCAG